MKCKVCLQDKEAPADFPARPLSATCSSQHGGPKTCTQCVRQTVQAYLRFKPYNQISCPECPGILNYETVMEYASPDTRESIGKAALLGVLRDDKNFVWVIMPFIHFFLSFSFPIFRANQQQVPCPGK